MPRRRNSQRDPKRSSIWQQQNPAQKWGLSSTCKTFQDNQLIQLTFAALPLHLNLKKTRWPAKKWLANPILFIIVFMLSIQSFAAFTVALISPVLFFSPISFWALPVHYLSLSAILSFLLCVSFFSLLLFQRIIASFILPNDCFPFSFFQKP